MRSVAILVRVALIAVLGACSGGNAASQLAQAPAFAPKGQTKCGVTKSQAHPLIVEWPAADRQELEAKAKRGLVPVRYEGCEMEVLDRCDAPKGASYRYIATEAKVEQLHISNADDLYANLPIGAAKLEGRLENGGELGVDMTMVGRYEAERGSVRKADLVGDCGAATHLISALTVGAFDFIADAKARIGAGATVSGIGAGADSRAERETLSRDGRKENCAKATSDDAKPPQGCAALLRVEVIPLEGVEASQPSPQAPADGAEFVRQAKDFAQQAEQSAAQAQAQMKAANEQFYAANVAISRVGPVTQQAKQHVEQAWTILKMAERRASEAATHAQEARHLATSAAATPSVGERSGLAEHAQDAAQQAAAAAQETQNLLQTVNAELHEAQAPSP